MHQPAAHLRDPIRPDRSASEAALRARGLAAAVDVPELDRRVHACPGHRAQRRRHQVYPQLPVVPRRHCRPQRPHRVHRPSRRRPGDEYVERDGGPDGDPGELADGASISSNGGDDEEEVKSDDELGEEGLCGGDGGVGDGDPAGEERVEDALEREARADGGEGLDGHVGGHLEPGEVAQRRERDGQRRVQVRARDVARRQDDGRHRQPRARRVAERGDGVVVLLVHDRRSRREEDEDERAHELRAQLQCNQNGLELRFRMSSAFTNVMITIPLT